MISSPLLAAFSVFYLSRIGQFVHRWGNRARRVRQLLALLGSYAERRRLGVPRSATDQSDQADLHIQVLLLQNLPNHAIHP
jgi:hypothetical protein